ncbi:MAG: MscS Mechanosensitive ion channel, partial [Candidatus Krumholzibacteriota bacterium]|nr:MscS Mechanosensitive ion channel [Candidatus Krumholzibacteriota bacterium]
MIPHARWLKLAHALLCVSVAVVLWAPRVSATTVAPPPGAVPAIDDAAAFELAPVTVDGVELFRVRGTMALPAAERAKAIRERIKTLAGDRTIPTDSLRVIESADRSSLVAPGYFVMAVYDADGEIERVPRHVLAETARNKIVQSVKMYREDRTPGVLLANTLRAVAVALGALLLLWLTERLFKRLRGGVRRQLDTRIERLRSMTGRVAQTETLTALIWGLVTALRVAWIVVIAYFSLNIVLGFYPWTRALSRRVFSIVLDPLQAMGTAFVDALPGLVFIAILWIVTRYVLKVIHAFFDGVGQNKITLSGFDSDWALPTYRITRVLIVAFAIVLAYPYIPGSGSDAFKGVSVFLGVIFSLGSSSIVANVIAGY